MKGKNDLTIFKRKWLHVGMNRLLCFLFSLIIALPSLKGEEKPFVVTELRYELGNQMFQVAAAVALSLDHGYEPYFPDLAQCPWWGMPDNYKDVFWRLNCSTPVGEEMFVYTENEVKFPIPAQPNMRLRGWFQSEGYFAHRKKEIIELFSPSREIIDYLQLKYSEVLRHPNTVAIHVRTYIKDYGRLPTKDDLHAFPGVSYYEKAVAMFPEDSLFILCSDDIEWCKENLSHLSKNLLFIEGNHYIHDFYLMSLCHHNIIANSTFSWWAAYLNTHPNQIVVTPEHWFGIWWAHASVNIILDHWIKIPREEK